MASHGYTWLLAELEKMVNTVETAFTVYARSPCVTVRKEHTHPLITYVVAELHTWAARLAAEARNLGLRRTAQQLTMIADKAFAARLSNATICVKDVEEARALAVVEIARIADRLRAVCGQNTKT